jgi:hypothetical protein
MATATRLAIDVVGCQRWSPECLELAQREYGEKSFYNRSGHALSVVDLPHDSVAYRKACSKVVKENANRAERLGYRHQLIDRADYVDDLFELRSSQKIRQGRRMPDAYFERQVYSPDLPPACRRHGSLIHGVLDDSGKLVAYCQLVQSGDVARFNTILGHAEYLDDRVTWLLVLKALQLHIDLCSAKFGLYYTHNSGHGEGLRYFKERFRFRPVDAEWLF